MPNIFSNTLPIFLITLLGIIIKRKWLIADEFWRGLEKLSYFLLFPTVLFNYIASANLQSTSIIKLVLALITSSCLVSAGLIYYQRRYNYDTIKFTSLFQGSIRYNSYIFFALSDGFFGIQSLEIVAIVSAYMIIFTNIISVIIFVKYVPDEAEQIDSSLFFTIKLIAKNPLIIASFMGFIFNCYSIEMGIGIKKTLESISGAALTMGMLNVGAGLKFTIDTDNLKQIALANLVKLLILPIVTTAVLSLMSISGMAKSIGILYSALPCASTAYVLSRQLGGDPDSMATIITFGTILSLVTIPILMFILT